MRQLQLPPQPRPPQFGSAPHHPQQFLPNGSAPIMPQPVGVAGLPPNKVIEKSGVRVLCIADVRGTCPHPDGFPDGLTAKLITCVGHLRTLNELAKKANADYILHTGDFGFYDDSSLERIADKCVCPPRPPAHLFSALY